LPTGILKGDGYAREIDVEGTKVDGEWSEKLCFDSDANSQNGLSLCLKKDNMKEILVSLLDPKE